MMLRTIAPLLAFVWFAQFSDCALAQDSGLSSQDPVFASGQVFMPSRSFRRLDARAFYGLNAFSADDGTRTFSAAAPAKSGKAGASTNKTARTNVGVFVPALFIDPSKGITRLPSPDDNPYFFETPQSVACVYGIVPPTADCNPAAPGLKAHKLTGGANTIAIVVPYHAPYTRQFFKEFSKAFHLPEDKLEIIFATKDKKE